MSYRAQSGGHAGQTTGAEREVEQRGDMDIDTSQAMMEGLLESFLTAALGLTILSRIPDRRESTEVRVPRPEISHHGLRAVASWHTDSGRVTACGTYHPERSQRMRVHVLWVEWWIPPHRHHEGWWRCSTKGPRDWTKGFGAF